MRGKSRAARRRYAVVGLGGRSSMYTSALHGEHAKRGELVAFCDVNQTRMDYWNRVHAEKHGARPVPTYRPEKFDDMILERKVDTVIVTSIDRTHHRYIVRAMELGCDAISEKPMTIDAEKCQAIVDAQKRTGRSVTVTFNYRYAPHNSKIREVLASGAIGKVISVHFEWLLDTRHGADYFRRWHRDKRNSGGLMVHKATHHFDLVNWWLGSAPHTVFGMGGLMFYGRANAEERGETRFYSRCHGSANAKGDRWGLDMAANKGLNELYLKAEHEDGYIRDQSVFGDGIGIEDDMAVLVRYRSGATMSYHLTAYAPWEGFRVMFNGTGGRLEACINENSYVSGADDDTNMPELRGLAPAPTGKPVEILLRPLWKKPVTVELNAEAGGHGGGDARILEALFGRAKPDPLGRAAGLRDGVMSIMTGICANRSFATGLPVRVDDLIRLE